MNSILRAREEDILVKKGWVYIFLKEEEEDLLSVTESRPILVAEWVYEQLQIQVAESQRSQVRILLEGAENK